MLLSISEQAIILNRICDMFGCVGAMDRNMPDGTVAQTDMVRMIWVNTKTKTRDCLVSAIMHEVCHILATKQGKYKTYHKTDGMFSKQDVYAYKKTAVNAEIYVDTWAERLTKMYFPDVIYEQAYRTIDDKLWKKEQVDKWASDFLQRFDVSSELEQAG